MNETRRVLTLAAALLTLHAALLALPDAASAQTYLDLTPAASVELIELHNAATTSRFAGEVRVAPGAEMRGDAAILNGPLVVEGALVGRVLVVNGSAFLAPGARVDGDLIVVGGNITGAADATVNGQLIVYREALNYRRVDGLIELEDPEPIAGVRAGRDFGFGNTSFSLALRGAYNRVEGLPVAFGPRVEFGRSNPTVVDASLIYRTAGGFTLDGDQVGHVVRLEQFLGGHGRFRLGVAHRSEVLPIEVNGLSDTEASLATFVLHRDYRDHYDREGWATYVRWTNDRRAFDATLEYRNERHRSRAEQSPWTLFDNGEPFRLQPSIAEGDFESIALRIEHDSRNDLRDPASGWWVRFESEQGLGAEADRSFGALTLDARRYLRLTPLTRAAVRVWAAGSVDGEELPPQRQHALGGEGTLPGFELFELDCGARDEQRWQDAGATRPFYYGCDRVLLGQVMLEQTLPFVRPLGRSLGLDFDFGHEPALALFADVGRAWIEDGAVGERAAGRSGFSLDGGIGVRLGRIGVYWAVPITEGGQGANFFVRIGSRI